ncbi:DNA mismatch repair endonuclease MutL [Kallotenue papyrolyticum]|uniref:DNA mismatch repair endonuclease MutL n=1 Tax=Kallotenue papyrolyticum TaxID=1325125 RepID=UPI0004728F0C|nr:DNA mismatch repair endonuclease MutL [Kallotenue papyrolyticum]
MPIRILEPDVAAKIAAGEVVERPASVVKELVENAIDAGATEIRVEIRGGGQREIRVSDNGCGIPADEVELAFQRHATSKIRSAEDLFDVHTLGFRGEALPSIATVAQVTCITRTHDAPTGVELRLAGGELISRAPRGGSPGTTFVVRNLFYNTPARLKFLRSEATEAAQINAVIEHYALAYPQIRWTLLIDGRLSLQTPGSGNLLDAIIELYGLDVARQLISVEDAAGEGEQATRVHGFVSQPSLTRSSRASIHLFVNRRWIRASGPLVYVIEEAYHTLLMKGRHPLAILNIEVDPAAVDVNVHPTKAEVKFLHQPQVLALLGRAVRAALAEQVGIPDLVLPGARPAETLQRRIELRQIGREREVARTAWSQPAFEPLVEQRAPLPPLAPRPPAETALEADAAPLPEAERAAPSPAPFHPPRPPDQPAARATVEPLPAPPQPRLPPLRVVGQVSETYIVAEAPDGLYLIDQHAAHERVIFEKLMREQGTQPIQSQALLLPVSVDLPPTLTTLLLGHAEELRQWGFEIEPFGEGTLRVRAVPHGLREAQIGPALYELGDQLQAAGGSTPADWREQALTTIACHSAVRAGQTLSHEEMRQLLQQLERCALPRTCPHGRPTTLLLSQAQLERQFGRKG